MASALALAGCGGGLKGVYTSESGVLTWNFKSSSKVEITTKMFGVEQTQEMDYEYSDGKIRIGPAEGPRMVIELDSDGCFSMMGNQNLNPQADLFGLGGRLCKEGSRPATEAARKAEPATAEAAPAAPQEEREVAAMKSDLRNLVTAQEAYFSNNVTYTTAPSSLAFTSSYGVTVTIGAATGTGWNATASHSASSRTCGIFVGSATAPVAGASEGAPSCR